MQVLQVAIDIPLYQLFSYSHDTKLDIGTRVLVEFKNKQVIGFVWAYDTDSSYKLLKPILAVYEVLPQQTIDIINFCVSHYHYPIGATIFCIIPPFLRANKTLQLKASKSKTNMVLPKTHIQPSLEQQNIINSISNTFGKFIPHILYGITGSGKTLIYLNLIEKVVNNNQQALILLPEINLTPQLLTRFANYFDKSKVTILNSTITINRRYQNYISIQSGKSQIIIGTRLAIFTPFKNLGLIIVDEEHDISFKQNDNLRYHARDLAVWLAMRNKIPVVLGSATPSLETLFKYKSGDYRLHKLTKRAVISSELPKIELINLNHQQLVDGLSDQVISQINNRLNQKELSLVFINRRGFCPIISCNECAHVISCNNCSTTLVYHSATAELKCHHCGYNTSIPSVCPKCNSKHLHMIGEGTQKIENSLGKIFPTAKISRIDHDTNNNKKFWDDLYQKIHNHEIDILVGTQMLAKGHDFPNLTLVVGLNIDNGLFSYDFRATEALFTQLTQVSGRAGRSSKPGLVLLQTYYPDHDIYKYLLNNDFNGFINYLLQLRRKFNLPPYTYYAMFRAQGRHLHHVIDYLNAVEKLMHKLNLPNTSIFSPVPAFMQKLKNKERGQILIESNSRSNIKLLFDRLIPLLKEMKPKHSVSFSIDIDPYEM